MKSWNWASGILGKLDVVLSHSWLYSFVDSNDSAAFWGKVISITLLYYGFESFLYIFPYGYSMAERLADIHDSNIEPEP